MTEADGDEPTVVDLIRRRRCDLVVNTPQGSGARADGYLIREAALSARVPCITTLAGAAAAVHAIANARTEIATSLQERLSVCASVVGSLPPNRSARTRCCVSSGAGSSRGRRGSSSCSRRPAESCRGR